MIVGRRYIPGGCQDGQKPLCCRVWPVSLLAEKSFPGRLEFKTNQVSSAQAREDTRQLGI
jgi:hypothetical protein